MGFFSRLKLGKWRKWTPAEFWGWFASPDGQKVMAGILSGDSRNSEAAQVSLIQSLKKVHPDLAWGVGGGREEDSRQVLEISAGGLKHMVSEVNALVSAAPDIPNWRIVAFKQPRPEFSVLVRASEESVDSKSVMVWPIAQADGTFDLKVYLPVPVGFPAKAIPELGFIMLDHVLGELAVMTQIGGLQFDSVLVAPPCVISIAEFAEQLAV